jgi:gamma-glutamyltranspeptidase
VLHNRGASFVTTRDHPNVLAPEVRPLHTLMPAALLSEGRVVGLLGAMGGHGQSQTLVQLIIGLLHDRLDPGDAVAAPRWFDGVGSNGATVWVEATYDPIEASRADSLGYRVERLGRFNQTMGHAQLLLRDADTGFLIAGADPRGEGLALGL